ncbi:hypothetical protein M5689_021688 [Euphorbia peplus]|nr:hypothetical protein M5689_021688 [Euphorbia peplus]
MRSVSYPSWPITLDFPFGKWCVGPPIEKWKPLLSSSTKLNIDVACMPNRTLVAFGCIIRDSVGGFISAYSHPWRTVFHHVNQEKLLRDPDPQLRSGAFVLFCEHGWLKKM